MVPYFANLSIRSSIEQIGRVWVSQTSSFPLKNDLSRAMKNDPIVEEVRQYRERHAAQFNYDLQAIYQDLKEQEYNSEKAFISYPAKTL
jgi:hypothetical protein